MFLFFRSALLWYHLTSAKGNFVKCIPKCTDEVITVWQGLGDKDTAVKNESCQKKTDLWAQNVDKVVSVILSICLPLSGISTILRYFFMYQEHLYGLCPPFFTVKLYRNRDFFPSLPTLAFDQCNWISWGFMAGTLGFGHFVPLWASAPVYSSVFNLCLQNERKAQSSFERDILGRNVLKDCEF